MVLAVVQVLIEALQFQDLWHEALWVWISYWYNNVMGLWRSASLRMLSFCMV